MMDVKELETFVPKKFRNEWTETVEKIDALASRIGAFTVKETGEALDAFKAEFRKAANGLGRSAVFGEDTAVKDGTRVQVRITDKRGRKADVTPGA